MPDQIERPTRYCDQPMGLQTHLVGVGGVGAIILVVAAGMFLSWQAYTAVQAPAHLSVFDVAAPAAPPEPQRDTPPGVASVNVV